MKFVLSGGGTGGHVNPALAIGSALLAQHPDAEMHYVGTPRGIENKLVPSNYQMHHVEIQGLRRSLSLQNLKTAQLTVSSFHKCKKLLSELRPDAVIGTGGYVCFPVCAAAAALKIPCFLHESNAVPGFAVKMLEKRADVIFLNFAQTASQLKGAKKTIHVGTPLRSEFYTQTRESARKKLQIEEKYRKILLSFGGSLGAGAVNREVLELMKTYGKAHPEVLFLHATGSAGKKEFEEAFERAGLSGIDNLRYSEYIFDMPAYMAAADLILCRSGAMTLSELALLGKPSILIPSPNVTNDQQTKNARLLSERGGAVLLPESELENGRLEKEVASLLENPEACRKMSQIVSTFAVRDAERVICRTVEEVIAQKAAKP